MPRLLFHPGVRRDLKKIPLEIVQKVHAACRELAANPHLGYRLQGKYRNQWAYDFSYRYRIIYAVNDRSRTVTILEVWHRSFDYRRH